jgi:hypothetical protein
VKKSDLPSPVLILALVAAACWYFAENGFRGLFPDMTAETRAAPVPVPGQSPFQIAKSLLGRRDRVYVMVRLEATAGMNPGLDSRPAEATAGESEVHPLAYATTTHQGRAVRAVVVYTEPGWADAGSLLQPMSVSQFLDRALRDPASTGIVINPGVHGSSAAVFDQDVRRLRTELPSRPYLSASVLEIR